MLLLQGSRVGSGQRVRVSSSELLALIKFEACGPAEPRPERPTVILVNLGIEGCPLGQEPALQGNRGSLPGGRPRNAQPAA